MHAVMQRDCDRGCIQKSLSVNMHGEQGGGPESQVTAQQVSNYIYFYRGNI